MQCVADTDWAAVSTTVAAAVPYRSISSLDVFYDLRWVIGDKLLLCPSMLTCRCQGSCLCSRNYALARSAMWAQRSQQHNTGHGCCNCSKHEQLHKQAHIRAQPQNVTKAMRGTKTGSHKRHAQENYIPEQESCCLSHHHSFTCRRIHLG